jgi:hypothetical protein
MSELLKDMSECRYTRIFPWMKNMMSFEKDNNKWIEDEIQELDTFLLLYQRQILENTKRMIELMPYDLEKVENTIRLFDTEIAGRGLGSVVVEKVDIFKKFIVFEDISEVGEYILDKDSFYEKYNLRY